MPRSIRWRLQVWYAVVLLTVVAGFAAILYYRVWTARWQQIDAGLEAAAQYLDADLRRFPPYQLEGLPPPDDRPPPFRPPPERGGPFRPGRPQGPPPRPDPERLLADLELPNRSGPGDDGRSPAAYFVVWKADGSVLKASGLPADGLPPDPAGLATYPRARLTQRGSYREAVMLGPRATHILVGRPIQKEQGELLAFAWQLAGAGAVVLLVGLAGGWLISARILRPVAAISATASAISATNLSQRIDPQHVDRELAALADVLNAMFDRLEAAFDRQARFTADASHELRTPLAILRSHAELALTRPRTSEEYRDALQTCLRAAGRMTTLVEGLLTLARADAGKLDLQRQPVDLRQVVEESVTLFRPLAEGKGVALTATLAAAEATGDAGRLAQVVTNLLSNAVQYNHRGGAVHVELLAEADAVTLSVADTGCGIPEADRPHLFERFYRVDKARSRASGGNGLGLAICQSIVAAHGGTIRFTSVPEQGTTFQVRLPLS